MQQEKSALARGDPGFESILYQFDKVVIDMAWRLLSRCDPWYLGILAISSRSARSLSYVYKNGIISRRVENASNPHDCVPVFPNSELRTPNSELRTHVPRVYSVKSTAYSIKLRKNDFENEYIIKRIK